MRRNSLKQILILRSKQKQKNATHVVVVYAFLILHWWKETFVPLQEYFRTKINPLYIQTLDKKIKKKIPWIIFHLASTQFRLELVLYKLELFLWDFENLEMKYVRNCHFYSMREKNIVTGYFLSLMTLGNCP